MKMLKKTALGSAILAALFFTTSAIAGYLYCPHGKTPGSTCWYCEGDGTGCDEVKIK